MTPDDIKGPALALQPADVTAAAKALRVAERAVRTVMQVESIGRGFSPDTHRPIILFEPHVFSRLTDGKFDASHPDISYPKWGARPYPATQGQRWAQLGAAMALNAEAAIQAASWGLFQILGSNFAMAGYETPDAFALAMAESEGEQMMAFARFVGGQPKLADALRALDWSAFARGYNGPMFSRNHYDQKLKAAYAALAPAPAVA